LAQREAGGVLDRQHGGAPAGCGQRADRLGVRVAEHGVDAAQRLGQHVQPPLEAGVQPAVVVEQPLVPQRNVGLGAQVGPLVLGGAVRVVLQRVGQFGLPPLPQEVQLERGERGVQDE
jgi:hypothetical protein